MQALLPPLAAGGLFCVMRGGKMKILMTAFDPFGGEPINASQEALSLLTPPNGIELLRMVVPTVFAQAAEQVISRVNEVRPDAVICLGQAAGRQAVTPERLAVNVRDASLSDNSGFQPVDEPIIPGGPAAFFSTLPVKKMVRHAQELGLPAAVSNTAGTFVCNNLMYSLLFYLEGEHPEIRAGFIHLPACHVLKNNPELPTMPIEIITAALEAMLAELLSED